MSEDPAPVLTLGTTPWLVRAQPFFACLDGAAGATRAVGGVVRDTIMGQVASATDIDMATKLVPEEVMERGRKAGLGVHPTGIAHGTVTLVDRGFAVEVTTLRRDVVTDGRRAVVAFGTDWRADAERRDFTMNALYAGPDGAVYDPTGGVADCHAARVRFIGDPDRRIAEDRLRVYRYFRFCATRGRQQFDASAMAACARAADGLGALSAERVGAEMRKLLDAPRATATIAQMVAHGVLDGAWFSPAVLGALDRLEVLDPLPGHASRMAALLAHGMDPAQLQGRWRLSNAIVSRAVGIASGARQVLAGDLLDAFHEHGDDMKDVAMLAAALADKDRNWVDAVLHRFGRLTIGPFPLSGKDLKAMGYGADARLGAEMARLKRLWIESEFTLDRLALLEMAERP